MTKLTYKFITFLLFLISQFQAISRIHSAASSLKLTLPTKSKTEGLLTLQIRDDKDQIVEYRLSFAESIDTIAGSSAVSIGYIGHSPTNYVRKQNLPTLSVNEFGKCTKFDQETTFIPELDWFVEKLLPNVNISRLLSLHNHLIGPTGLVALILRLTPDTLKPAGSINYRDIMCRVYQGEVKLSGSDSILNVAVLVPQNGVQFNNFEDKFFSIRASRFVSKDGDKKNKSKESEISRDDEENKNRIEPYKVSFKLDYFNIDSFDGQPERYNDQMREDFNLPFGKGCSEFVYKYNPIVRDQSFTINYYQTTSGETIKIAYDREHGLLRRELPGKSLNIYDLNEMLLYYENLNSHSNNYQLHSRDHGSDVVELCSVVSVKNEKLSSVYKLPTNGQSKSVDVLQFFGASSLAYMGRGQVRDMPCLIYETILDQPPAIFFLSDDHLTKKTDFKIDYIVEFYLLHEEKEEDDYSLSDGELIDLTNKNFWPAKITIYRRINEGIQFLDELEIYEYYSSLNGNDKKNIELFMASKCFRDNDSDQLKLELDISFDGSFNELNEKNNDNITSDSFYSTNLAIATLLNENKIDLESHLINDILDLMQISRMHLIDYEMKFDLNDVDLKLILADRSSIKLLKHFGDGDLPNEDSYQSSRIITLGLSEETCVLRSSLITDITMVVYCPFDSSEDQFSTCKAIFGESEPTIRTITNTNPLKPACQVYRYESIKPDNNNQLKLPDIFAQNKIKLINHQIKPFKVKTELEFSNDKSLIGVTRNFDILHELKLDQIDHYMFASKDNPFVKSFANFKTETEGDCAKICNLDPACKSYSYCHLDMADDDDDDDDDPNKDPKSAISPCSCSSLDLKKSKLREQLIYAEPNMERIVDISGPGSDKYKLQFRDNCNIYERNYLNMFSDTGEVVRIPRSISLQIQLAKSTFDCAKQSVDLELDNPKVHIAMFAYCATLNVCLLDEQLLKVTSSKTASDEDLDDSLSSLSSSSSSSSLSLRVDEEIECKIYRKKYQNYFDVSSKVLKLNGDDRQQVEFELNSVEECARACWNQFGQICASFDYCSPGRCLINQIDLKEASLFNELEIEPNCLHYERDLRWDDLRKNTTTSLGRHQVFDASKVNRLSSSYGLFATVVTYFLSLCSLFIGLLVGRRVDDRMVAVTVHRQSMSSGPMDRSARSTFDFESFSSNGDYMNANDDFNLTDDTLAKSNAIQLNVINTSKTNEEDEQ